MRRIPKTDESEQVRRAREDYDRIAQRLQMKIVELRDVKKRLWDKEAENERLCRRVRELEDRDDGR